MSLISSYKDPIIPDWNRDENGDKVSELITNEQKQVVGNRITLDYLPDIQYRVFINENFIEIDPSISLLIFSAAFILNSINSFNK